MPTSQFEMIGPDGKVMVATTHNPDGSEVTTGDPEYTQPPQWVPSYPGSHDEPGGMTRKTKSQISGTYLATTKDAPDKVRDFFESTLQAAGFATEVTTANIDGQVSATVTAKTDTEARQVVVTATDEHDATHLVITYEGMK